MVEHPEKAESLIEIGLRLLGTSARLLVKCAETGEQLRSVGRLGQACRQVSLELGGAKCSLGAYSVPISVRCAADGRGSNGEERGRAQNSNEKCGPIRALHRLPSHIG